LKRLWISGAVLVPGTTATKRIGPNLVKRTMSHSGGVTAAGMMSLHRTAGQFLPFPVASLATVPL